MKRKYYAFRSSYLLALRLLHRLKRRLEGDSFLLEAYIRFLQEYQNLGHMVLNTDSSLRQNSHHPFFLPQHRVLREKSSTNKLRVVCNRSQRTKKGFPLNECPHTGPTILPNLMQVVFYEGDKYPLAASSIRRGTYVDDITSGADKLTSQTSRNHNYASGPASKGMQRGSTSEELSLEKNWNSKNASVPLLKGMTRPNTSDELSMQSRGYEPPDPVFGKGKLYEFYQINNARFAFASAGPAPIPLYEVIFQFSQHHVLKCEVPSVSLPRFEPINNEGRDYSVAANSRGDIVGIYLPSSSTILRIYESDAKTQVTVNIGTLKVKPYRKVFG
ncbi:uncharacterized protein LOC117174449 [Belonocnema kinseyi]|uniref:uncharacterized protein LOC117174449 n=1 Tax=Belonocnema kinseyi TaxID=2817044 RepID=UPI00143D1023|nr:uncharacterized protein LOC117174449 [Belonocnema kinseyi]